jgi:hypothetical protein
MPKGLYPHFRERAMPEFCFTAVVDENGRIKLPEPLPPAGSVVEVRLLVHADLDCGIDVIGAAGDLDFWNEALDSVNWSEA